MRWLVTTLTAILALATATATSCRALEVDCLACDFCRNQPDLQAALDARIHQLILQGKSAGEIAESEGGDSLIRSPIELWADVRPEAVKPNPRLVKYRGSMLPNNLLVTAYAPCVKLNGVCIGTDKLGHLFQTGWELYRISVVDGKGDALAAKYAEWLEGREARGKYSGDEAYFRKQRSGAAVGYGGNQFK